MNIYNIATEKLDKVFEFTTKILGSTPVIIISILWCVMAFIGGNQDFLDVISMVTFIFGELILRGQNVQSERTEKDVKKDLRKTDEIKSLLNKKVRK